MFWTSGEKRSHLRLGSWTDHTTIGLATLNVYGTYSAWTYNPEPRLIGRRNTLEKAKDLVMAALGH